MSQSLAGLHVLVVSPFAAHSGRGNAVTAARTARRLAGAGASSEVVHADEPGALAAALTRAWPDVILGIHAGHFARTLEAAGVHLDTSGVHFAGARREVPAIVLGLGGNELYEDLGVPPAEGVPGHLSPGSWELFERADAVLAASDYQLQLATERRGSGVFLVPRYPEVGFGPIEGLAERLTTLPPGPTLVWSGALRPQKRPEWLAPILRRVAESHPTVRLLLAGPLPTDGPGKALDDELCALPGVLRVPPFHAGPGGSIGTLLAHADIAWNTSRTEGTSNFLLEAIHAGVPVVAADCAGTQSWATGHAVLYHTIEEGAAALRAWIEDPTRAAASALRAREWQNAWASPERETQALSEAVLAGRARAARRA